MSNDEEVTRWGREGGGLSISLSFSQSSSPGTSTSVYSTPVSAPEKVLSARAIPSRQSMSYRLAGMSILYTTSSEAAARRVAWSPLPLGREGAPGAGGPPAAAAAAAASSAAAANSLRSISRSEV